MQTRENGLFIFRRDLRTVDNNGLYWLSFQCKNIYPVFIFTPEQVSSSNDYKSNNAVIFMIESLIDLEKSIKKQGGTLQCFYGDNDKIIKKLVREKNIDIVCFNRDYTPYAKKRDDDIFKLCTKLNIACESSPDYYLHEPGTVLNGSGEAYQKFTPYYNTAKTMKIQSVYLYPLHFSKQSFSSPDTITLKNALSKFTNPNPEILVRGGRANGLTAMKNAVKNIRHYASTRDNLMQTTSLLSAYIKFGCVSIREVYTKFKYNTAFTRQLMWRDFYASILNAYPKVLGHAMKSKYNQIKWKFNKSWYNAWCNGKTGYPIVDAAMRQMNETGYMHNRGRLLVASFLTKTLLISWEKGEKYFATKLTDYDPASNNGNWQWVASTGADAQPYFRIFSPFEQMKRYDPKGEYVKKWIPELRDVSVKTIHNWDTEYENIKDIDYPKPIVNFSIQREKALEMYSKVFN